MLHASRSGGRPGAHLPYVALAGAPNTPTPCAAGLHIRPTSGCLVILTQLLLRGPHTRACAPPCRPPHLPPPSPRTTSRCLRSTCWRCSSTLHRHVRAQLQPTHALCAMCLLVCARVLAREMALIGICQADSISISPRTC